MSVEHLARPEIRDLSPYQAASRQEGTVRLNANESPSQLEGDTAGCGLNRYPEIRPENLHVQLATHYGIPANKLLATRGSSEGIDLLIRGFCRSGRDSIVVMPPTFAMYGVYANVQGATTIEVPLTPGTFELDVSAILEACTTDTKLIFICSPNNPTGALVPQSRILELAEARRNRSLVVVDEAYAEFSKAPSAIALMEDHDNIIVLRTLSKALSLAGVRCGAVLGAPPVIRMLDAMLAPYALATPVIDCVLKALTIDSVERSRNSVDRIIAERHSVAEQLSACSSVRKVWPSEGNFLLVQFTDLDGVQRHLQQEHILVRDFGNVRGLENCARITIGNARENQLLLSALARFEKES